MNRSFFEHALHNEKALDFISKEAEFNDWSITIAFYTALHFVRAKSNENGEFITFDEWFNKQKKIEREKKNFNFTKHEAIERLAFLISKDCGNEYKRLSGFAKNSRYSEYKVDPQKMRCVNYGLAQIKKACYNVNDYSLQVPAK